LLFSTSFMEFGGNGGVGGSDHSLILLLFSDHGSGWKGHGGTVVLTLFVLPAFYAFGEGLADGFFGSICDCKRMEGTDCRWWLYDKMRGTGSNEDVPP